MNTEQILPEKVEVRIFLHEVILVVYENLKKIQVDELSGLQIKTPTIFHYQMKGKK